MFRDKIFEMFESIQSQVSIPAPKFYLARKTPTKNSTQLEKFRIQFSHPPITIII
jgi:hypothetical protein